MALMQACFMGTVMSFLIFGGLMGKDYASDPAYSTLPVSAYVLGAIAFVVPFSLLMARRGRRAGFLAGAAAGIGAGLLCMLAWSFSSFAAVFAAGFLVGIVTAANAYLRFAALEIAPEALGGRVTSLVLSGGIVAAALSPHAPSTVSATSGAHVYLSLGIAIVSFNVLALALSAFVRFAPSEGRASRGTAPGYFTAARSALGNPFFLRAITASVTGYALMLLVMHATPLKMTDISGYSLAETEAVMRNHFLAMFVPYLFSGMLMDKYGAPRMIYAGFALFFACILCLVLFQSLGGFHAALILLGLGWNFTFLGGTKLVYASSNAGQGAVTQSVNELSIAFFNFLASVLSGWMLYTIGWEGIQVAAFAVATLAFLIFAFLGRKVSAIRAVEQGA